MLANPSNESAAERFVPPEDDEMEYLIIQDRLWGKYRTAEAKKKPEPNPLRNVSFGFSEKPEKSQPTEYYRLSFKTRDERDRALEEIRGKTRYAVYRNDSERDVDSKIYSKPVDDLMGDWKHDPSEGYALFEEVFDSEGEAKKFVEGEREKYRRLMGDMRKSA